MQPDMSALIVEFDTHGTFKRNTPTTFHIVNTETTFRIIGAGNNTAVEIKIGEHKTVEVNIAAIKTAELTYLKKEKPTT